MVEGAGQGSTNRLTGRRAISDWLSPPRRGAPPVLPAALAVVGATGAAPVKPFSAGERSGTVSFNS